MDFEFFFDPSELRTLARVTHPHEAFGAWLSYELEAEVTYIESLIERLKSGPDEWFEDGDEWRLTKDNDSISVKHHSLFEDYEDDGNGLKLDGEALEADAGIEDFLQLLEAWVEHLFP
ncbi:YacL family protein [Echinimonas agarilytica]|uniref:YacL family protein n=1 Tax=Echinimonas agarilytica TaxID=1215918 RepID=A0AA41WAU3_9GAMM|nr:YacL family protein [Echinimonas agarilytica]MCM2681313.1 YacL family protein [Echinimonas agarilytica]